MVEIWWTLKNILETIVHTLVWAYIVLKIARNVNGLINGFSTENLFMRNLINNVPDQSDLLITDI